MESHKILDAERFLQYEKSVIHSKRLDEILASINCDNLKILDIGGASGLLLKELSIRANKKIYLYNLEVDNFYSKKQSDPKINFLYGSILNNKLREEMFDIVTFGDVLHHLIGKSFQETISNQEKAIWEIFRITKKGGFIIFSEEVNNIKIFSTIIYFLSKLANRLQIKFSFFETGKVIVLFPTQKEIARLIKKASNNYQAKVVKKYFEKWNMSLKWKLTLLMSNVGRINYVIKKKVNSHNK